ncbi:dienelactone hydrolase family protein [Altericroceibacterium spongiae]|uniref:Dienelactone hydrolase family protein n=1 Tax=Altericroceibacterium spongiae TaxID=2320269 RepID=A0A420EIZ4_9SPHN|nr:dienelactone hydrolase family protein [Altericroceibacterium spongiae]RKF20675.1 dienelactone hydrolase family protein [Altericroceibacterium spongiae]
MCDEQDVARWAEGGWNRRQFTVSGAMAALAACSPARKPEGGVTEAQVTPISEDITLPTTDGEMDAVFIHPTVGDYPAVILWPDVAGSREVFRLMARRLTMEGYAVLVVNPYYRDAKAPVFAKFSEWMTPAGRDRTAPMRDALTPEAIMSDAKAVISWLDTQDSVDTMKGGGTIGFCMGGPFTVFTAAAVPGRIRAAASFHGGGLVSDDPMSPHRLLEKTQAGYLFAIARNDDKRDPAAKTTLHEYAEQAAISAEIEVYPADHGWTVADSPSYDKVQAERAWGRMLSLFEETL